MLDKTRVNMLIFDIPGERDLCTLFPSVPVLYLEALVVTGTTAIVLGKLDNNLRSVHNVTVELVNSLLSITGILQ